MTVTLKERREMDKFKEILAFSTVKSFYPTAVLKYAQMTSLEAVFDYLIRCVEDGELRINWEVKCNNEEMLCIRKILNVNNKDAALNKDVSCDVCGNEFVVSNYNLFPKFEITQEYREIIREDFKKKEDLYSNKIKLKKEVRGLAQIIKEDNNVPSISFGNLPPQTQLNIQNLENLQVVVSGGGTMNHKDRGIHVGGDINGSPNMNNGDNVIQVNQVISDETNKLFDDLLKDISEKTDVATKPHMEFLVDKLKEAYEKEDKKEGSKIIGLLQSTLGNIGSLASIASLFGFTLPL